MLQGGGGVGTHRWSNRREGANDEESASKEEPSSSIPGYPVGWRVKVNPEAEQPVPVQQWTAVPAGKIRAFSRWVILCSARACKNVHPITVR